MTGELMGFVQQALVADGLCVGLEQRLFGDEAVGEQIRWQGLLLRQEGELSRFRILWACLKKKVIVQVPLTVIS